MSNPPPPGALMVPLAFAKQIAHSTTEIDGRLHAAAVPWPGAPDADGLARRLESIASKVSFGYPQNAEQYEAAVADLLEIAAALRSAPPKPEPSRGGSFDSPPGEAEQLAFLVEALAAFGLAAVTTDDLAIVLDALDPTGFPKVVAAHERLRAVLERTADA